MRKSIAFVLALFFISFLYCQTSKSYWIYKLNSAVKSLKETKYFKTNYNSDYIIENIRGNESIYSLFDKKGNITEYKKQRFDSILGREYRISMCNFFYNNFDKLDKREYSFFYNNEQNEKEERIKTKFEKIQYDIKGRKVSEQFIDDTYYYNAKGDKIKQIRNNQYEKQHIWLFSRSYNKKGLLLEQKTSYDGGFYKSDTLNIYDEKGRLIEQHLFDDGVKWVIRKYQYNNDGLIIERNSYSSSKIEFKYETISYKYDSLKNVIKESIVKFNSDGTRRNITQKIVNISDIVEIEVPEIIINYKYIYDDKSNWIEMYINDRLYTKREIEYY